MERELGASPVALAQTRRLLTAKQLLTDSRLPMAQVALASGFGSVRRFNALFRSRYRMAPGELRRSAGASAGASGGPSAAAAAAAEPAAHLLTLTVGVRPPYDWPALCAFLAARAVPGVECVHSADDGPRYWRTVQIGDHCGVMGVGPGDAPGALRVRVDLALLPSLVPLLARLRQLLDLDAMPLAIAEQLGADPLLAGAVAQCPGRRVPGAMDPFELAVRAILGQQVSVRGATTLAGRLVAACAEPLAQPWGEAASDGSWPPPRLSHAPLSAERLADASPQRIADIGLPRARAECLHRLARTVADGGLRALRDPGLAALDGDPDGRAFEREFTALPGIGPWTAQYVAMRALRSPDAFPDGDLALRRKAAGSSLHRSCARAPSGGGRGARTPRCTSGRRLRDATRPRLPLTGTPR